MNYKLRRSIQQIVLAGITGAFATGAFAGLGQQNPPPGPNQVPDYFGIVPNFANSPEPVLAVVSGGSGTGAAATTYDYTNWATTPGITDVQGGKDYVVGDVLTITGGAVGATCTVTVNNVSTDPAKPEILGAIIPNVDGTGAVTGSGVTIDTACNKGFTTPIAGTGIRKFRDALPGIPGVSSYINSTSGEYNADGTNLLGQSLPVATPDTTTFPGSDYYEIEETEYTKQLHSDLPATHLRGYRQLNNGTDASGSNTVVPPTGNQYLGPIIVAQKGRAVRIKLVNHLSTGDAGKLPVPVDTTYMGVDTAAATENRTALHLHGGNTPWISDGTPRQTVKPKGETTGGGSNKGESVRDVPDMWFDANGDLIASCAGKLACATGSNNPGDGSLTYYFTNQQSARLMFYHDHAEGITRLNVYTGIAAGYVLQDPTEQAMVNGGSVPQLDAKGQPLLNANNQPIVSTYTAGTLPPLADTIPLVIQEKTFVPNNTNPVMNFYSAFASQLQSQDPTWRWGTTGLDANGKVISTSPNGNGDLWVPHVFMPNQNPGDITGGNAMGRWDYGPWFWPPFTAISNGPIANPYYDPSCNTTTSYCEPNAIPGVPNGSTAGVTNNMTGQKTSSPSGTPEAFNDTPLVNGTAYPYINVSPKQYRLRLLSVGNDRMLNLSLVVAASKNSKTTAADNAGAKGKAVLCDGTDPAINQADCTEVKMVPFDAAQDTATKFPSNWYTQQKGGVTFDGRPSGVFDPRTRGPAMVQIGTEGGFLSSPVVIKNQPVNYEYNPKNILIGNIKEHALLLGPAERADVLVDFSNYAGATLIMYNDAPAPVPAWDLRLDYYTGNYDNTDTGGAFSTIPGYGPNTRTVMQIRVSGSRSGTSNALPVDDTGTIDLPALTTAVQTAFRTSQEPIIVPQAAYNPVYGLTGASAVPDSLGTNLSRIADFQLSFKPLIKDAATGNFSILPSDPTVTMDMSPKTIIEDWTMNWGRMNALLGTEVPRTTATIQTSIPQAYIDPPTELVKITPNTNATPISGTLADGTTLWKITHNGVDSHSIHFHLFHVQLVNRVGWDGAIYPPEANELGWKDSVLMHPLSDVVVALRPMKMDLPFKVANSHRKIDPSNNAQGTDFFNLNPMTGNAANVTGNNLDMNYGWEYVWHCHILGHEENDMMRAIAVAQPPETPDTLTATTNKAGRPNGVTLDWKDNSMTANWVEITRSLDGVMKADNSGFKTVNATFSVPVASLINPATNKAFGKKECDVQAGCLLSYTDTTAAATTSYYYRVVANNTVGGGAGRADKPLVAVAGGGWDYSEILPAAVNSLVPNLTDAVTGVMGYSGYANVTASSDAATVNRPVPMPIAVVSPANLAFGNIATANSSVLPVTLTNTGTLALTISTAAASKISITGTNANQFSVASNPCGTSLAANGATCTINVTFTPTTAGSKAATLTITDNSNNVANSKQTVTLTGTGVVLPPTANLNVSTLAFPDTMTTTTSAAQTVTLTNKGSSALTVNRAIAFTGPFARTGGTCTTGAGTFTLAANASCTVGVTFTPTATGAASGSLVITDNNGGVAGQTQTVSLSGNGIALVVTANPDTATDTSTLLNSLLATTNEVVTVNVRANDTPANTGTVTIGTMTKTATTTSATATVTGNNIVLTLRGTGNTVALRQASKRGVYTIPYTLTVNGVTSQATATITVN
jgi:FtsP/CotA-like multicopper oxidase with cupredoxin domain